VSLTRNLIAALALLTGVGTLSAAPNGDVEAGKTKSATCQACHGADGNTTIDGSYPKLAGQYATYLAKALHDYKSGERKNPIMAGFAATLSDQDIADLLGLSWVKNAKIGPEPGADVLMSGEEQTEELFCTKLEVIRSCHKQGLGSCAVHLDLLDEKRQSAEVVSVKVRYDHGIDPR